MNPWERITTLERRLAESEAAHLVACQLLAQFILNSPQVRIARTTREANAMFGGRL